MVAVPRLPGPDATRRKLLEAAAEAIHRNGFRATSVDSILSQTGVTKGALYYHFPNKRELGLAVLDEVYRVRMLERWGELAREDADPIEAIRALLRETSERMDRQDALQCGCPLNNLAQEMSAVDDDFRRRIEAVFDAWRNLIREALERGQSQGAVRENVDTRKAAIFITSVMEGAIGTAKNAQDPEVLRACMEGLTHYLEALRPRVNFRAERSLTQAAFRRDRPTHDRGVGVVQ